MKKCGAPTEKPPFTLSEIKKAIPPHCFNRSLSRSLAYVIIDSTLISLLFYLALKAIPSLPSHLRLLAWPLYWVCQGCVFTGIWMIGHDCGHHAFSDYLLLDDTLGFLIHSLLLTPYFSWKISHRHHHNNTSSMENDEIYVPRFKATLQWYKNIKFLHNPLARLINLSILLLFGYPMYLLFNFEGRCYTRFACHYDPYSPLYTKEERAKIILSDVGVILIASFAYWLATTAGFWWMFRIYFAPLFVLNTCVVWITYLHHTHSELPHYDSREWDYLRGALSTVDRDYGALFNLVFHNITNAHVVHHIVSTMPHYHGLEATKAIRSVLGEYYRFDGTPVIKALWRETEECVYVEEDRDKAGVYWYRK